METVGFETAPPLPPAAAVLVAMIPNRAILRLPTQSCQLQPTAPSYCNSPMPFVKQEGKMSPFLIGILGHLEQSSIIAPEQQSVWQSNTQSLSHPIPFWIVGDSLEFLIPAIPRSAICEAEVQRGKGAKGPMSIASGCFEEFIGAAMSRFPLITW